MASIPVGPQRLPKNPKIKESFANPRFWDDNVLNQAERRAVISELDTEFGSFTVSEQDAILERSRPLSLGETVKGFATGMSKGGMSTLVGIHDVMPSLPGLPAEAGGKGASVSPEFRASLEPTTGAESAGKFTEQASEYFIPSGLITRGMKTVSGVTRGVRGARAANIAARAGLEAASEGVVTAAQTGGDPDAILAASGTTGLMTAVFGLPFEKLGKVIPENRYLAAKYQVMLTQAKQTQNLFSTQWEGIMRKAFGGQAIFHTYEKRANESAVNAAKRMSDYLGGTEMSTYESGAFVQKAIQDVLDHGSDYYNRWIDNYVVPGTKANVKRVKGQYDAAYREVGHILLPTASLKVTAKRFMETHKKRVTSEGSVTENILNKFMNTPNHVTWEWAWENKKALNAATRKGELDLNTGQLTVMHKELDRLMTSALRKAGRSDLSKVFSHANATYAATRKIVKKKTLETLLKSKTPESAIAVFLQKGRAEGVSRTFVAAMDLLPTKERNRVIRQVKRSIWDEMLSKASLPQTGKDPTDVLLGNALEKIYGRVGEDALSHIYTKTELAKLREFVGLLDTLNIQEHIAKPVSSLAPNLLAFGVGQAVVGYGIGGIGGGDEEGGGLTDQRKLAGALVATLGPAGLALFMTRPGAVNVTMQALKSQPGTPAFTKLVSRISGMVAAQLGGWEHDRSTGVSVTFPDQEPPEDAVIP